MFLGNILGMQGIVVGLILILFFFGGRLLPWWTKNLVKSGKVLREGLKENKTLSPKPEAGRDP